jgi:biopolymer transport protein ExbD
MMQQGFPVTLPQSRRSRAVSAPVTVTVPVSYRKDRRVQIGDEFIPITVLSERIRQAVESHQQKHVMLRGDGVITLNEVMSIMDVIQAGGVEQVNLQTQPATGRQP